MQVTEQEEVTLLLHLFQQLLDVVDRRMSLDAGVNPDAIQVTPGQRATCVAINNTVWVHHRDDFDDKVVAEHARSETRAD